MNFNLQIFLLVQMTLSIVSMVEAHCVHPPYAEEKKTALYRKIFHDYYLGRWSYNVIREYRKNAHHIEEQREARNKGGYFSPSNVKKLQSWIYGEPKCRKNRNVTRNDFIGAKSTCPWFVVMDVDFNREPQTLAKAKCSCKRCLSQEGGRQERGSCATVNSYIPVIKWECPFRLSNTDNYYHYFIHMEEVPVGCTCKRSRNV